MEAIFGCSGLVFPGGITSVILPFSFRWDADLVTRGDTAAGTAGGGELLFSLMLESQVLRRQLYLH